MSNPSTVQAGPGMPGAEGPPPAGQAQAPISTQPGTPGKALTPTRPAGGLVASDIVVPQVEQSTAAAAAMARTQIEARFQVAMLRPRDWPKVRENLLKACQRPRFAEEARYKVPRGKTERRTQNYIEGLSVRFAEEAARDIGNIHVESRVTFDDHERRVLSVTVTDLEANVTWPFEVVVEKFVERKQVGDGRETLGWRNNSKNERVYKLAATDDEVLQKQNILVSKAARNGVLRLLPGDIQEECLEAIQATMDKAAKAEARDTAMQKKLVAAFADIGVSAERLAGFLGHPVEEMTPEDYQRLRGIGVSIREGETTWDEVEATVPATSLRHDTPGVKRGDYD